MPRICLYRKYLLAVSWPMAEARAALDISANAVPAGNRLLILEADPQFAAQVADLARSMQIEPLIAVNLTEFERQYLAFQPSMLSLDVVLGREDVFATIEFLGNRRATEPIFLVSGYDHRLVDAVAAAATCSARHVRQMGAGWRPTSSANAWRYGSCGRCLAATGRRPKLWMATAPRCGCCCDWPTRASLSDAPHKTRLRQSARMGKRLETTAAPQTSWSRTLTSCRRHNRGTPTVWRKQRAGA